MFTLKIVQSLVNLNSPHWDDLCERALGKSIHPRRKETFLMAREALRLALCEREEKPDISDLLLNTYHSLPRYPQFTLSLSHCPDAGVALLADRKMIRALGIDVERKDRLVKDEILHKVSHPLDLNLRNIELWVLKEAIYKCLSNSEEIKTPLKMTEIQISQGKWLYSPAALSGSWELREKDSLLLGLAWMEN